MRTSSDTEHGRRRKTGRLALAIGFTTACLLAGVGLTALPAGAQSDSFPPQLWQRCDDDEPAGQRCTRTTLGVAANPANGRVYLIDYEGNRVIEYSAWGEFLRTWGWGVVAAGPNDDPRNEIQELTVDATGGDFLLRTTCFRTTSALAFNATAAQVEQALEELPDKPCSGASEPAMTPAGIAVSGPDGGPWSIEFTGENADIDFGSLRIQDSTLTGGAGASVVEAQKGAHFETCTPNDGDVCRPGDAGAAPGQLASAQGLAVDSVGDVYLVDRENERVQKFDLSGSTPAFSWMAGAGVNEGGGTPDNAGDLCTAEHLANGDTCGAGAEGTDPGQFSDWRLGDYIGVDTAGTATSADDGVWVGDKNRIQRFGVAGAYQDEVTTPGETTKALDVDSEGNLLVAYATGTLPGAPPKPDLHRLSPSGASLGAITVAEPFGVAAAPNGDIYVVDGQTQTGGASPSRLKIRLFSAAGSPLSTLEDTEAAFDRSYGIAVNPVTPEGDIAVYISNRSNSLGAQQFLRAYSPIPDSTLVGPPPPVAPSISQEGASSVSVTDASVGARINPHFWEDASYYLEYGDQGPCDSNPCAELHSPGLPLDAGVVESQVSVELPLADLEPDTTYNFRFVAGSSGGGPSFGAGGSFTTFPHDPAPLTDCPNQQLRTGASARLPDCRAWEMVSPVDKNGDNIRQSWRGVGDQAALDGDGYAFNSVVAFGDAQSSPALSNYIASRDPDSGWSTHALNPPQDPLTGLSLGNAVFTHSANLAHTWLGTSAEPTPDPAAPAGYENLYRRDNDTDSYTVASTVIPPTAGKAGSGPGAFEPRLHGFAADGSSTVFSANDRLLAAASSATASGGLPIRQLYQQRDGEPLELVSRLPDGGASDFRAVAGGGPSFSSSAVSADGERVYWTTAETIGTSSNLYPGRIYVRVDGDTTVAVSETVSGDDALFWGAARDGSAALFSFPDGPEAGNLYRFDLVSETSTLIAGGVFAEQFGVNVVNGGVIGFAHDLSAVYLVSTAVLDGGPNSEGDTAVAGDENTYHYREGEGFEFVARMPATSAGQGALNAYGANLRERLSQVSADGLSLAFATDAPLTGYDNRDQASGARSLEVFVHSAQSGKLSCISCDPSGARPEGVELGYYTLEPMPTAAWIPGWNTGDYRPQQAMSEDGRRVFFDAYDDILPADTNGKADVYEWQAPGSGECTTEHAHYFEANDGCLHLISSGKGPTDSTFGDATPDGETVFVRTERSLLAQDSGLYDIYAARVEGGFPPPEGAPVPCEGDGCQPPATEPEFDDPGSGGFEGAENPAVPADCRGPESRLDKAQAEESKLKRKLSKLKWKKRRASGKKAKRVKKKLRKTKRKARRAAKSVNQAHQQLVQCRLKQTAGEEH